MVRQDSLEEYALEDVPEWAEEMYQYTGDGRVYSIEKNSNREGIRTFTHKRWKVVILPENFRQDNSVLEKRGEYESKSAARSAIKRDLTLLESGSEPNRKRDWT